MEWDIEGIANQVMSEMKEDNANIADMEYYLENAFRSVQSREPSEAKLVIALVKTYIEENYEE